MASTMMLASLLAVSGLKGFSFSQDIMDAVDWATEFVTKINPQTELTIKQWLRDGLAGGVGEDWAKIGTEILLNGPSRYLTGMDLGQRFGQGDLVPGNPFDLFGPVAGAIAQFGDAAEFRDKGQSYQAAEKSLPKALGNIVGAAGYQDQGVLTKGGNRVMHPSEFTDADVSKKAMGFQPAGLARGHENLFDVSKIDADARKASAGFYKRLANHISLAEDARTQGDKAKAARHMAEFDAVLKQYLDRMQDPKRPDYLKHRLSRQTLKKEIANGMDWSRRFVTGSPRQARPEIMKMLKQMGQSVGELE